MTVQHNLTTPLPNSTMKYYQHARLDPDGTVRVYIRPKTTMDGGKADTSWDVASQFPSDGCGRKTGLQGMCGPNAYCTVRSKARYMDCECPGGYVFVDARYKYQGCRAGFVPHSCDGKNHSAEFNLVELPNTTKWRTDLPYYKKHPSTTEAQCREICLNDCFCTAALLTGSYCIEMGLLIGDQEANDTTVRKALIKVRTTNPSVPATSSRMISKLPHIIFMCLLAFATVTIGLLVCCLFRKKKANESLFIARVFTYKELHQATNGFKEELGRGGFGVVYKGVVKLLQSDDTVKSTAVAVKKLSYSDDYREKEFTKEVQSIGRIHHRNLIRMIGYCKEGRHRILVFEFMSEGSLGDFMKRQERPPWSWLAEAVLGIARGLEYLHYGCTYPIIHCDIKPDNILLDHNRAPRITDFGISKLLSDQQVQNKITKFIGTEGYVAPEWSDGGNNVDNKVDVYSFGIVLLQMICWKITFDERSPDDKNAGTVARLKEWAENLIRNGRTELLVQGESEVSADMESVDKLARVAIWCIQKDPLVRPTMRKVVLMLEGTVVVDPLPDPQGLLSPADCSTILSIGNGTYHSKGTVHTLQID